MLIGDVQDQASIDRIVSQARVIVNLVGPYTYVCLHDDFLIHLSVCLHLVLVLFVCFIVPVTVALRDVFYHILQTKYRLLCRQLNRIHFFF